MKGNSGLLWRGLTSVTGTLLVLGICGTQCSYMYAGTINSALGTSSTRIVAGEGGGNTTYYASEYGDLNAENLQKLIADAYGIPAAVAVVAGHGMQQRAHGRGIEGELTLRLPARHESMNIATSWPERRKAFYYNTKLNCLQASGRFSQAGKHYHLSPVRDLGVLDWGRGVWTYNNTWYWASASGYVDGEAFGLNLGYGFSDRSPASENLLLYRGVAHKLDQVAFHFDRKNWLKPWQMRSNDGRLQLDFTPCVDRNSKLNLLLLASEQHQVFGHYRGHVTLDNGQVLQLNHLPGFAEEVHNRW